VVRPQRADDLDKQLSDTSKAASKLVAAQKEIFDGATYDKTVGEFFFNMRPSGDVTFSLGGKFGDAVDYDNDRPGRLFRVVPGLTLDLGRAAGCTRPT